MAEYRVRDCNFSLHSHPLNTDDPTTGSQGVGSWCDNIVISPGLRHSARLGEVARYFAALALSAEVAAGERELGLVATMTEAAR